MRNLDMATLRSFLMVAERGGVTRAAGVLHLTQSAVSMQLKRLEDLLGVQLLDRSNRSISLTASGEQLLGYARRIINLNDEVVGRLTDEIYEGEIILGVPHDIIYPVIPRVLKAFNTMFPRVNVQLLSSSTNRLHEALSKGEVQIIVTTEGQLRPEGETLTEMSLSWTGAIGGQIWKRRPMRLAFCNQCIFRSTVIRRLDEAGIAWEMTMESEDDRSVEAMVSADLAVSAMLEGSLPPYLEVIANSRDLPDLGRQKINMYGAVSGNDVVLSQMAELLRREYYALAPQLLKQA